ncbi:unnamed protein product, partial [Schistocephalus solidus]|uniref:Reverse transcriptase domain-containing protein n=1 Tax=Schistocephalus solidus TaxID=70667 RepID=A0A183TT05_SCHSO
MFFHYSLQRPPSSANVFGTPSAADQHLLSPSVVGEGHVDAPSVAVLASAGLCSRPELRSTGRAGNQGDPRCRWLDESPPRHFPDEAPTATQTKASRKNGLHKAYMDVRTDVTKAAFFRCRRLEQQRLRKMQDAWVIRKAEEIQGYADRNEMKNIFKAIKTIFGPCIKDTFQNVWVLTLLKLSLVLMTITDSESCAGLHSEGNITGSADLNRLISQSTANSRSPTYLLVQNTGSVTLNGVLDTNNDLDLPPSLPETIRAMQQISSGKAPGSNAFPTEVFKHDATIVHLYKRKGNRQLCDNHRGISLLNIAVKIFANFLLNRLNGHLENGLLRKANFLLNRLNGHLENGLLPESQCGFRRNRGTSDMIFAASQLQEKYKKRRNHLYTTFMDLTKAFDTVIWDGLWKVMQKFGCPKRFTHMVSQLHDGMTARVTDSGTVSKASAVTNGVKQGCVLAPTLLSLMFSAMMMDAYCDKQPGIRIAYRTDGHLLNS